jgi:hypothetical protein
MVQFLVKPRTEGRLQPAPGKRIDSLPVGADSPARRLKPALRSITEQPGKEATHVARSDADMLQ